MDGVQAVCVPLEDSSIRVSGDRRLLELVLVQGPDLEQVADDQVAISVLSSDQDFAKKEFGSDEYHPAHRFIKLKNELSKKTK